MFEIEFNRSLNVLRSSCRSRSILVQSGLALTPEGSNPLVVLTAGYVQVSAKVSCSAADDSACNRASAGRSGNHSAARSTCNAAFSIVSETSAHTEQTRQEKNDFQVHRRILRRGETDKPCKGSAPFVERGHLASFPCSPDRRVMVQAHFSCRSGLRIEQYQKAGLRSATSARFRHFIALMHLIVGGRMR